MPAGRRAARAAGAVLQLAVLSVGLPAAAAGYLPADIPNIWAWWDRVNKSESALNPKLRDVLFNCYTRCPVAISGDGSAIVVADGYKHKVFDGKIGRLMFEERHDDAVNTVAISSNGFVVVTGSIRSRWGVDGDGIVQVWGGRTGALMSTLKGHSVAISGDGAVIVTGSLHSTAKVWDGKAGALVSSLGNVVNVTSVAISGDGAVIVTGSVYGYNAKVWGRNTGDLKFTLEGHEDFVDKVAISSDGSTIMTGSRDGTAKVWDGKTGALISTLGVSRGVRLSVGVGVAVSSDGAVIVTGSVYRDNRSAKIWDGRDGRAGGGLRFALRTASSEVAISSGGAVIVTSSGAKLEVWRPPCDLAGGNLQPDGSCVCAPGFTGKACKTNSRATEAAEYAIFYVSAGAACGFVTLFTWNFGCDAERDEGESCQWILGKCLLMRLTILLRSFDMMSDWAFWAIINRKDGEFAHRYAEAGGDHDAFWTVGLIFCIIGVISWLLDMNSQAHRLNGQHVVRSAVFMCWSVLCEDIPQLVLQSIYFNTMGFINAGDGAIPLVAFIFSLLSLLVNSSTAAHSVGLCNCRSTLHSTIPAGVAHTPGAKPEQSDWPSDTSL